MYRKVAIAQELHWFSLSTVMCILNLLMGQTTSVSVQHFSGVVRPSVNDINRTDGNYRLNKQQYEFNINFTLVF